MVGERNRLRLLEMGKARHIGADIVLHDVKDRLKEFQEELRRLIDLIADIQPHVERDLVIAAPARVQLLTSVPDPFCQHSLDKGVDIFTGIIYDKLSTLDILLDSLQSVEDLISFFLRQDPALCQHLYMRAASAHVLLKKSPVKADRLIKAVYQLVSLFCEPSAPKLGHKNPLMHYQFISVSSAVRIPLRFLLISFFSATDFKV